MSLIANEISYIHPSGDELFLNVNFSLIGGQKAALIGHNGAGKSTLMRILAGLVSPSAGEVQAGEASWYVPQHFGQFDQQTVAEALGIAEKIEALRALLGGDAGDRHFEVLQDDWGIEERVLEAMTTWQLGHLAIEQPMQDLSGGEKTRAFLAGIAIHEPTVILLDEPTNHLDTFGRQLLYSLLGRTRATVLVISHDRSLLNEMDQILELEAGEMHVYGGNYDFYREQKDIVLTALKHRVDDQEKQLRQAKIKANALAQQRQKQESRGRKEGDKKSLPRIIAGGRKNQAEVSTARLNDVHQDKMDDLSSSLSQARAALYARTDIKIDLPAPAAPEGKMLLEAENLLFTYGESPVWEQPLSFSVRAGERLRIAGPNGSGKTTLLRMVTGELMPSGGDIWKSDMSQLLLDQEYSIIDRSLTVIAQVQKCNIGGREEHVVKASLNRYQFPKEMWDLSCNALSGGELMKLAFCCLTISAQATDMLVLDEPTNNLDLKSQEILTAAVRDFKGALIVISHDQAFLDAIGLEHEIVLD